jgi:hypothetical protein
LTIVVRGLSCGNSLTISLRPEIVLERFEHGQDALSQLSQVNGGFHFIAAESRFSERASVTRRHVRSLDEMLEGLIPLR